MASTRRHGFSGFLFTVAQRYFYYALTTGTKISINRTLTRSIISFNQKLVKMNLKQLLFGRLSTIVPPATVTKPEPEAWVLDPIGYFKIAIIIVSLLMAFLAGFFCWWCVVLVLLAM